MKSMWCLSFYDLEKAYDTTWKYGIMKVYTIDLRGRKAVPTSPEWKRILG